MFNAIPIKILMTFFTDIEKSFLMFTVKQKWPEINKAILSKRINTGVSQNLSWKYTAEP
jgi:hypothetical protein